MATERSTVMVCKPGPVTGGVSLTQPSTTTMIGMFSVFRSSTDPSLTPSLQSCSDPNLTVITWDQFLSLTRFDDDSEWHDNTASQYKEGTEPPLQRRSTKDTKKRSKSDVTSARNNGKGPVVRKNSASYRHSLPGIIENTCNNPVGQGRAKVDNANSRSSSSLLKDSLKSYYDPLYGSNLDKKSVSMSDLRTLPLSNRINSKLPTRSQDNISQTSSSSSRSSTKESGIISSKVSKIFRIMHTE